MTDSSRELPPNGRRKGIDGGIEVQPVRLVLLLLAGPRAGDNDFLEFPAIEDAIAFGRELYAEPRFQLDAIEDANGKTIMAFDQLNELCSSPQPSPHSMPQRRYG